MGGGGGGNPSGDMDLSPKMAKDSDSRDLVIKMLLGHLVAVITQVPFCSEGGTW